MAWAKLDDQLHGHPKVLAVWQKSHTAIGLHMLAMSYCAGYGTEGVLPGGLPSLWIPDEEERAIALSSLTTPAAGFRFGLWEEVDGGWRIHDWAEYNGDPRTREKLREAKSRAGKAGARARWANSRAMADARQPANGRAIAPSPYPFREANASPEIRRLSHLLADLIRGRDPKAAVRPDSDGWLRAMRLLVADRDDDLVEVERVIRWCQADSFWQNNILSPKKLREKFTQLALKAGPVQVDDEAERKRQEDERWAKRAELTRRLQGRDAA